MGAPRPRISSAARCALCCPQTPYSPHVCLVCTRTALRPAPPAVQQYSGTTKLLVGSMGCRVGGMLLVTKRTASHSSAPK